jgi:ribosomal RNA assembly protein
MLEELTDCMISVYGGTVSIIGPIEKILITREAVLMLINGAFHKTVWNYLYAYRRKIRKERGELWYKVSR